MRIREKIKNIIIIGSSRGLGSALVEEFLNKTSYNITGVARTSFEKIEHYRKWDASGRYYHVELDITSPLCNIYLKSLCSKLYHEPICVIFNAARLETDVNRDGSINYDIFVGTNRVGIDGFGNVIATFEEHLLAYGGILVGISSFSAFMPPFFEPKIAYPSSKAYLDMAFRCLRIAWSKKVKLVIVHLGHIGNPENKPLPRWIVPTYPMVAKRIVRLIASGRVPCHIDYPILYCLAYKYILRFIPDRVYLKLLQLLRYFMKVIKL